MIAHVLAGALALAAAPPPAEVPPPASAAAEDGGFSRVPAEGPDLELHVPNAEVQKVSLEVENLEARLDLDTRVANLVEISAGVVANVQKLKLQLEGVRAETHLVVRLDRVADVLKRALGTLDDGVASSPGQGSQPIAIAGANAGTVAAQAGPAETIETAPTGAPRTLQHKE